MRLAGRGTNRVRRWLKKGRNQGAEKGTERIHHPGVTAPTVRTPSRMMRNVEVLQLSSDVKPTPIRARRNPK